MWKKSCLARRRFVSKKRLKIKWRERYEDIVNDDELARLNVEWRASVVRVRRVIWSSKEACWKELLRKMDLDPWGFSFRLVTNKLRDSSGPLTTGMTEECLEK